MQEEILVPKLNEPLLMFARGGTFHLEHYNKDGELIYKSEKQNTVLRVGKQLALDILFGATSKVTTWHIGISNDNTALNQDYTLAGEVGTRQSTTFTRTGETTDSSQVSFTGVTETVRKAFVVSASTSGTIFAISDLSTPRTLVSTDTLRVIYSISAA